MDGFTEMVLEEFGSYENLQKDYQMREIVHMIRFILMCVHFEESIELRKAREELLYKCVVGYLEDNTEEEFRKYFYKKYDEDIETAEFHLEALVECISNVHEQNKIIDEILESI